MQLRVFKRVLKSLLPAKELMALWRHLVLICHWRVIWEFCGNPEFILTQSAFVVTDPFRAKVLTRIETGYE